MQRLVDGTLAGMTEDEAIERARELAAKHKRAYVAYTVDCDDEASDWRVVSNKSHITKPLAEPSGVWHLVGVNGWPEFSGYPWYRRPPNPEGLSPDAVQRRRASLNLTQQQLADHLGLARATVNRWERGHEPIPKWLTLALDRLGQLAAS